LIPPVILAPEYLLPDSDPANLCRDQAVLVNGGIIQAIGSRDDLKTREPDAIVRDLPGALLLAGFVNAHQHGRGLSQIQLGYADDFLEAWIAGRKARGVLDAYAITKLVAARMVANGVTTAIHANYSYGSGDYETEVRQSVRAYLDIGMRVSMSIGILDRGQTVYPPHDACFCAGLPSDLNDWLARSPTAYMPDVAATIDLLHRLRHDYRDEPRVTFAYGPAGPQWVKEDSWRAIAEDAAAHGLGLHLHALESSAQRDAVAELYPQGVFAALKEFGALTPRTVIAHGVWMTPRDCAEVAAAGATVVRNPGSNLRLRSGIAPLADMLAAGVRVAVGTDNTACDDTEDLLGELRMAGLLARSPEWNGPPPPSTRDLLAMLTENGAVAAGFAGASGRIEVGAPADLVALDLTHVRAPYLDRDTPLLDAVIARGRGADVALTMVGGDIVHDHGTLVHGALPEIEAAAAASALAARLPRDPASIGRTGRFRAELVTHYQTCGAATAKTPPE
jgi:cytosine/adenosine deaminase-related metal-dependent hydrolase